MSTIQLRKDTLANWTSVNPVLAAGEVGVITDTSQFKIGNGVTAFASLPLFDDASAFAASVHSHTLSQITDFPTSVSTTELGYLDGVTSAIQTQLNNKLSLTGGTMTGAITSLRETSVAMPANDINLSTGNLFTKTITVNTAFTVSNIPASGQACSFVLQLTNGGSKTITWFSGVKWAGGTAPTLTSVGVDILAFYTIDAGVTWRGMVLAKDSK